MQLHRHHTLTGVTRETLRYVRSNSRFYFQLWAGTAVLYAFVYGVFFEPVAEDSITALTIKGNFLAVMAAQSLLFAAATAAVAVPLHNRILGGVFSSTVIAPANVGIYCLIEVSGLWIILLVVFVLTNMMTGTSVEFGDDGSYETITDAWWVVPAEISAIFAALFAAVLLSVRFVGLLPHVAITPASDIRWKWAFDLSRGWFWLIALRFTRAALIIYVAYYLLDIFAGAITINGAKPTGVLANYSGAVLSAAGDAVSTLFYISLASMIFRRLSKMDEEAVSL